MKSDSIHGTIDVVIMTREGFVIATDSRVTHSDNTHADDQQKVFIVGANGACAIAGLIGSEIGVDGFRLRDSLTGHFAALNHFIKPEDVVSAERVANGIKFGYGGVVGLLPSESTVQTSTVLKAIAVSVQPDGTPGWITVTLVSEIQRAPNGFSYLGVSEPQYNVHPLDLSSGFDFEAVGYPAVAIALMAADEPSDDVFSNSEILRKYYCRKAEGHLDKYTIGEAAELAKTLVEATEALAPVEAGVGGPIDILQVTKAGAKWVVRKEHTASPPPSYVARFFGGSFGKSRQDIDGLECVLCSFTDIEFTYRGDADVELLGCKFEGACKLTITPDAAKKMPGTVDRLKRLLRGRCQIIEEGSGNKH